MKLWPGEQQQAPVMPIYTGKLRFLTIAAILGIIIAFGFAILEWQNGNISRALADLVFPVAAPFFIYYLWKEGPSKFVVLKMFALIVFLSQVTVGFYLFDYNQLIWVPTYPLIYFYLLGHKGWSWSVGLYLVLWAMYFFYKPADGNQHIPLHVMSNFMLAYLLTALLSWMNSREVLFFQHTLAHKANHDPLTGVYNRAAWRERIEQEVSRIARNGEGYFSVILLDIDNFKQINDSYGHKDGDVVLVRTCKRLGERLRKSDVLGRWGGEEFVVLLPDTELEQASHLAEQLRLAMPQLETDARSVTASFGVARYGKGDTVDGLMIRADKAMYQAKHAGKNRVVTEAAR